MPKEGKTGWCKTPKIKIYIDVKEVEASHCLISVGFCLTEKGNNIQDFVASD